MSEKSNEIYLTKASGVAALICGALQAQAEDEEYFTVGWGLPRAITVFRQPTMRADSISTWQSMRPPKMPGLSIASKFAEGRTQDEKDNRTAHGFD